MKTFLIFLCSLAIAHGKYELAHVDLAKLRDPATALEVIKPLGLPSENWQLTGYLLLTAPQRDGKPPLQVLATARDYISVYERSEDYKIENEEALFGKEHTQIFSRFEPSLQRIHKSVLFVFDDQGDEIRPFGGNNYISKGYLYDFDRDGILDRADSTNHGLDEAPKHSIEVFELRSVEPEPHTLLKVVFNWHPNSADDANDWNFECFDDNADGIPEIAFGPMGESEKRRREIVFRWDAETKNYTAGAIPPNAHVRVMQDGDTLKSIAAKGGLGYPLITDSDEAAPTPELREPYVFESFAGRPIADLAAFFKGAARRDIFDEPVDSFPNAFPENFFSMPPKEAAMSLAEANRTPTHREQFRLAIDDLNGITPPPSGWAHNNWGSSGCYSFSSELYAVHFGTPDPVLITFGYNSIGVVGQNPYADYPANNARLVTLSEKEATFIVETTFWLDRIRSKRLVLDEKNHSSSSSTADGFGSFSLYPKDGQPTELASETDWAMNSISGKWTDEYDRTVFINLTGLLFQKGIPEMLGERWKTDNRIEGHDLMTPTEERLADRIGDKAREELAEDFSTILKIHSDNPLPPAAIARLCSVAGNEALVSLLPDLEKLQASLPPLNDEDKEFKQLEERFARTPFGTPREDQGEEYEKGYARYDELREKREFDLAATVRYALDSAILQLQLASDPTHLKKEIIDGGPFTQWALSLLARTQPGLWAALASANFAKAEVQEKRTIFRTLSAGHPPTAAKLGSNLDAGEKQALILEIANFHQQQPPFSPSPIPSTAHSSAPRKKQIPSNKAPRPPSSGWRKSKDYFNGEGAARTIVTPPPPFFEQKVARASVSKR
jgi:hypothetical protein